MSYQELLEFAASDKRFSWQRDALRRLATNGELTETDVAELEKLIEIDCKLTPKDDSLVAEPLVADHLSETSDEFPCTKLTSLGPVHGIDRLAGDQKPLQFALQGITLIYGNNGSGKSGYTRITKKLCRAQKQSDIRGDAFSKNNTKKQINVGYKERGTNQPPSALCWDPTTPAPKELSRICVFDNTSAQVYVDEKRKIEFLPYELHLLHGLNSTATKLKEKFESQQNIVTQTCRLPIASFTDGTGTHELTQRLTIETPVSQIPSEKEISTLAHWDETYEQQLTDTKAMLANTPQSLHEKNKLNASVIGTVNQKLDHVYKVLADSAFEKLKAAQQLKDTKDQAAIAAKSAISSTLPLPEIGSEAWRSLLQAAQKYTLELPGIEENQKLSDLDKCVLCQQPLSTDATARLIDFEKFLIGQAQNEATQAKNDYDRIKQPFLDLSIPSIDQIKTQIQTLSFDDDRKDTLIQDIAAELDQLSERLRYFLNFIKDEPSLEETTPSQRSIEDRLLAQLSTELEDKIKAFNPEETSQQYQALQQKYDELQDKKKFASQVETIQNRRTHLVKLARLNAAENQCQTQGISTFQTKRRRVLFTQAFQNKIKTEMRNLGLGNLPLKVEDNTKDSKNELRVIPEYNHKVKTSDVLSEGEQRVFALAGFLTELEEMGKDHGIIIDDPVSSLDHVRMEKVANRLTQEGVKGRQVIIFTHNILFHHMIREAAKNSSVPLHQEWLGSTPMQPGQIGQNNQPPHKKKVNTRIADLKNKVAQYKKAFPTNLSEDAQKIHTRDIYTYMRETWERIIEEVLFGGAIQRFEASIKTRSLREAYFKPEEDYQAIENGMSRCSKYSGHDTAQAFASNIPTIEDIEQDLLDLENFFAKVSKRKKTLSNEAGSYDEPPAAQLAN